MTSGARNSGVPKLTLSFSLGLYLQEETRQRGGEAFTIVPIFPFESFLRAQVLLLNIYIQQSLVYLLARPKSMILILFVALLTHNMFSGWKMKRQRFSSFDHYGWNGESKRENWKYNNGWIQFFEKSNCVFVYFCVFVCVWREIKCSVFINHQLMAIWIYLYYITYYIYYNYYYL